MLLNNYSVRNLTPGKEIGASTNPYGLFREATLRGLYIGEANIAEVSNRASLPNGYGQESWLMAPKAGGMSTSNLRGAGALSGAGFSGLGGTVTMEGSGILEATGGLLAGLVVEMTGSGNLTALGGGLLEALVAMAGAGALSGALGATAGLTVEMAGIGTLTANPSGTGEMVLEIFVNESQATVQQIVDAVWSALAADFNISGTMGNKLNGAGSAGDPWTTDLTGYNTADTAGKIVKEIKAKAAAAAALSA